MIKNAQTIFISLVALAILVCLPVAAQPPRPNVVLLLADDLGSGDLSCYGSPETKTPNLDQLAASGVRFTDFYAGSAVCSPSRACLSTGRFSVRVGVYSWIHPSHRMHLPVDETTIAEHLKAAGYDTGHFGKWHLGGTLIEGTGDGPNPGDHGFDYWLATDNNAAPSHLNPDNFVRNGKPVGETDGYSCQLVVDEALGWLATRPDQAKPFFLNVWFHEPHSKVAAPPEYEARHASTKNPAYYGCIENMDAAVGRLLARLDAMGVRDSTLVIFTSDNGSYMEGSNGALQGKKTQLFEGGIREPGIIRWPGHIAPGSVERTPAGVVDLLPTICEAVGIDPAGKPLDGVSLVPLFVGRSIERPTPLFWFYNPSRPVCVIREGDWCLTAEPDIGLSRDNMFLESYIGDIKAAKLIDFKLYNLREDPHQDRDVSAAFPERFEEMKRKIVALHKEVIEEAPDWRTW